jgi:hypothetical protein
MSRTGLAPAGVAALLLVASPVVASPAVAADLSVSPRVGRAQVRPHCGPCGCWRVTYVYHRVLESTYGRSFDPRNDDQTEPHYYFGRVHAFPRYFVDGVPVDPGSC